MASVKWLTRIEAVFKPFTGYQQRVYSYKVSQDDTPIPVTRIRPRSLLAPPGIPDFLTRKRLLRPGPITLTGRAWSGEGPIVRVEVSVDDGRTFSDAQLAKQLGTYAWREWSFPWNATNGNHVLVVRATDHLGQTQPQTAAWNTGGFSNNSWQRVEVTVNEYALKQYSKM